jgi:hypothetical protein
MVVHKAAFAVAAVAAKGVIAAGHAVGHYWAAHTAMGAADAKVTGLVVHGVQAHPLAAGAIGAAAVGVPIMRIAYLDKEQAIKIATQSPQSAFARTVKFSVAGKLVNGEFSTITGPFNSRDDLVLLGSLDEAKQEIVSRQLVRADRVESRLVNALSGGNFVVFA